ncbi:hypothetical protein ACFST9_02630 [Hymenobacter monticola]|uniref:Tetratricopeptide repeat protein n=1 Tax=Hymenobacter monticola TaxID=1705399 RepID=A0ABY4B910_9BACT|nr:hypothetical protein [Hymenobacter monticola]UOE33145.1 hypothetical protein MTP16_18700 [Hymenobacter monticola]
MHALHRHAVYGFPQDVERLATQLLAQYPAAYGADFQYPPTWPRYWGTGVRTPYQPMVYAYRAEARRQRGNFAGAEADLTQTIALAASDYPYYEGHLSYSAPAQVLLKQAYYERATLRRGPLNNPAGACADLAAGYELDPDPKPALDWHGCLVPATHAPRTSEEMHQAQRDLADSLASAQRLLATGRLARAETLLAQLEAGHVGRYAWVQPRYKSPVPLLNTTYLRSELALRRGQYAEARTLLESLVAQQQPQPLHYYALGTLKIDHFQDRDGGCADLRWAYAHNPDTLGWRPDWRGCALPRRQLPVTPADVLTYRNAYADSLKQADIYLTGKQFLRAERLLTRLLTTRAAARFVAPYAPLNRPTTDAALTHADRILTRDYRSRAYEGLADYARAAADLDTLIDNVFYAGGSGRYHCRRGVLRADYLHDRDGACADFARCYQTRRYADFQAPPGRPQWRNCSLPGRTPFTWLANALPDDGALRLGYFSQGATKALEVGYYRYTTGNSYSQHGPSAGLEMGAGPRHYVLAPKLSYEATAAFCGTRLDVAYYVVNFRTGGLRLTPQAGLLLWGFLNVFYGYSIPLTGSDLPELGPHRIGFHLNFTDNGPSFKIGG